MFTWSCTLPCTNRYSKSRNVWSSRLLRVVLDLSKGTLDTTGWGAHTPTPRTPTVNPPLVRVRVSARVRIWARVRFCQKNKVYLNLASSAGLSMGSSLRMGFEKKFLTKLFPTTRFVG